MSKNNNFHKAKKAKNDEFYTLLTDIEKELRHYRDQFKGKVIYCNADDPYESNFFKYFAMNFKFLGLKKLISTSYNKNGRGIKIEIDKVEDFNGDGAVNIYDVEYLIEHDENVVTQLNGDGDFRSPECIEILKRCDIVVTNPPFSIFREFIALMEKYDKKFLVVGNMNALTYKEIFRMFKEDKIRTGNKTVKEFITPNGDIKKFGNINWFTNLNVKKHKEEMILYKTYYGSEELYPKYDNYNAINVDKVKDIPCDYFGVMGVPITFIDKHNPEQFEIVGSDFEVKDGLHPELIVDGWEGKLHRGYIKGKCLYARILIKRVK